MNVASELCMYVSDVTVYVYDLLESNTGEIMLVVLFSDRPL
jgi:hypothetical protein